MRLFVLLCLAVGAFSEMVDEEVVEGRGVWEQRGYYKRELSLVKPYQGSGMSVPYWDIGGTTMITSESIRLTSDSKAQQGYLWNQIPVMSRDWEMMVTFRVSGSTGDLFGDGMALWYAKERMVPGNVFGSKDYFKGVAVFLDTYSNHNGAHSHGHPYVSAMVANGSSHYDHDQDGTHTQLGGDHTGCEAKFRNHQYQTNMLIRYVANTFSIYVDVANKGTWQKCLSVPGVRLPTGLYFGASAATGDLSDAHDILSMRFYDIEFSRADDPLTAGDGSLIEPEASIQAAPRDHVESPKASKLGWFGTILLLIVAVVVIAGVLGFGMHFLNQRSLHQRKRFY